MVSLHHIPQFSRGLFVHQEDYYALLGVPLIASPDDIKKAYRQVAMALRQGIVGYSREGQGATTIFAKLVNPAKERLTSVIDKESYDQTLHLLAKKLIRTTKPVDSLISTTQPEVTSLICSKEIDADYIYLTKVLSNDLYNSLDALFDQLHALSDLNLAYLLLKNGAKFKTPASNITSIVPKIQATPSYTRSSSVQSPPAKKDYSLPSIQATPSKAPTTPYRSSPKPSPQPTKGRPVQAPSASPVQDVTPSKAQPSPTQSAQAQTHYQQAQKLITRKLVVDAIAHLNLAIKLDPKNETFYLERARLYRLQSKYQQALADYEQVSQLDPYHLEALQSIRDLESKLSPASTETASPLPPEASSESSSQARPDPVTAQAHYLQAQKLITRKLVIEAITHLGLAIAANPNIITYYLERARLYRLQNKNEQALADYERVSQLDPYHVEAMQAIRDLIHPKPAQVKTAQPTPVKKPAEVKTASGDPTSVKKPAEVKTASGDLPPVEATAEWKAGKPTDLPLPLVMDDDHKHNKAEALYQQALDALAKGHYLEAVQVLGQAIKVDPDDLEYYLTRARVHRLLNQMELARIDYDEVLHRDQYNIEALQGMRDVQSLSIPAKVTTAANRQDAQQRYRKALEMMERQSFKKALQYLGMAIDKDPRNIDYYLKRAQLQRQLKNAGMARADYKRALQLDPENAEALKGLQVTLAPTQPQPILTEPEPENPVAKILFMDIFPKKDKSQD